MPRSSVAQLLAGLMCLVLLVTACSSRDRANSCDLPAIDPDVAYRLGVGDKLRVASLLDELGTESLDDLTTGVLAAVDRHTGGAPLHDDLTFLALEAAVPDQ